MSRRRYEDYHEPEHGYDRSGDCENGCEDDEHLNHLDGRLDILEKRLDEFEDRLDAGFKELAHIIRGWKP